MAVYFMNAPAPYVIEENLGVYFDGDQDDISLAEVLQDQEIVYESFQRNGQSGTRRAAYNANLQPNPYNGQNSRDRGSSRSVQIDAQLAVDEAIAKELQDLENKLSDVSLHDNNISHNSGRLPAVSSTSNARSSSVSVPVQASPRQDDIDPDNMTYEELQELGDAIGTESRGLSNEMIAYLPSSTYKIGGIFSRKDKYEECVICCMAYKNKDKLITLPCEHKYHKTCVTKWLKINKTCPVCGKEVLGS